MRQVEVTSKTENIGGNAVFTVANHLCTVKFKCSKENVEMKKSIKIIGHFFLSNCQQE